ISMAEREAGAPANLNEQIKEMRSRVAPVADFSDWAQGVLRNHDSNGNHMLDRQEIDSLVFNNVFAGNQRDEKRLAVLNRELNSISRLYSDQPFQFPKTETGISGNDLYTLKALAVAGPELLALARAVPAVLTKVSDTLYHGG